jgi:hypothetical protein
MLNKKNNCACRGGNKAIYESVDDGRIGIHPGHSLASETTKGV